MKFGIYLPPGESKDEKFPVLFYLSGLTCSEQNVITKAGYQRLASQYKIIFVAPDTSPSTFSQCISRIFVLMAYNFSYYIKLRSGIIYTKNVKKYACIYVLVVLEIYTKNMQNIHFNNNFAIQV